MKTITIFFSDERPIVIEDHDDRNIEEYISELSKVLESNNIAILHTSSSSTIIRPNTISAVVVSETGEKREATKKKKTTEKAKEKTDEPDFDIKAPEIEHVIDKKSQDIISD